MATAFAPPSSGFWGDGKFYPMGGLGWSPETFWGSTLLEFHTAMKVFDVNKSIDTDITPDLARKVARERGYKIFGE
ncbi:MAG: hypothetical protein ABJO86_00650 [Lentilitoribacter sp.]